MATITRPVVKPAKNIPPTPVEKPQTPATGSTFLAFGRRNYQIMLAGIGLLILGFVIMASDKEEFGFGFLGLTLGPIIVVLGFITQFFAILHRPNESKPLDK